MAAIASVAHASLSHPPIQGASTSMCSQVAQSKFVPLTTASPHLRHGKLQGQGVTGGRILRIYAEYSGRRGGGAGDFVAGFLLGGVVFGALGYVLAPEVSKRFTGGGREREEGSSKKLPANFEDDEGIEKTRRNLNEKIAQLNAAIDDVSAQLRADDGFALTNGSTPELESAI